MNKITVVRKPMDAPSVILLLLLGPLGWVMLLVAWADGWRP